MARERKPNETAIKNMLAFLHHLKDVAESGKTGNTITKMQTQHGVSQTTGSVLKELGIIKMIGKTTRWQWNDNEPDRKMALIILDKLLQKRKPGTYTPLFPDMAKIVTLLEEISGKLNNVSPIETNASQGFILSEEEKRFRLLLAVTQGYYANNGIGHLNHAERNSSDIIHATEDLLKQYNEKFKSS